MCKMQHLDWLDFLTWAILLLDCRFLQGERWWVCACLWRSIKCLLNARELNATINSIVIYASNFRTVSTHQGHLGNYLYIQMTPTVVVTCPSNANQEWLSWIIKHSNWTPFTKGKWIEGTHPRLYNKCVPYSWQKQPSKTILVNYSKWSSSTLPRICSRHKEQLSTI